jgi:D-beta-D-heptose 7-phosphate kinase/D-beta-D-heptose 1-phosphate adenosyltransferase
MKKFLKTKKAHSTIDRFKDARVLLVGDLIMDHFIWGDVKRISPEAPVPVVDVVSESILLGGAANVANNICSLRGKALICGVIGNDDDGRNLIHELRVRSISNDGIIVEKGRPTTIKTRIIAHNQQVVRFDREKKDGIKTETMVAVVDYLKKTIKTIDVVVISDYSKGLITKELVRKIVNLGRRNGKIIVVDPKVSHLDFYRGATVVTPNNEEASQASDIEIIDKDSLLRAGQMLLKRFACQAVLITRGEHGMSLFERGKKPCHIPTVAREVYDVSGAGDTVVAVMALSLASGATFRSAAVLANYAASIVVSKIGTATVGVDELNLALKESVREQ